MIISIISAFAGLAAGVGAYALILKYTLTQGANGVSLQIHPVLVYLAPIAAAIVAGFVVHWLLAALVRLMGFGV